MTATWAPVAAVAARTWRSASCGNGSLAAHTNSTRSASATVAMLRSTPSRSTVSSVARSPAVSYRRTGTPWMSRSSRITSRVVPGTSVTSARASCARRFSSDDLPTLGGPASTTWMPSRSMRPVRKVASMAAMAARTARTSEATSSAGASSMSSSAKSSASSTCTAQSSSCCRSAETRAPRAPFRRLRAPRREAAVADLITSATASA